MLDSFSQGKLDLVEERGNASVPKTSLPVAQSAIWGCIFSVRKLVQDCVKEPFQRLYG